MRQTLDNSLLKARLAVGTAMASVVLLGYGGRSAYADCSGAYGIYVCSGVTTTTQDLDSSPLPLSVTTASDFEIAIAATGNALNLTGVGGVSFTDENASVITGESRGIMAQNSDSGDLEITTTGPVSGVNDVGIYAQNGVGTTNLTIHSASVTGDTDGIAGLNSGNGALSITATGSVSGASRFGILADNSTNGTDLTIEAASVDGDQVGILAQNYGSGALSITSSGTVSSSQFEGIYARNINGTDLTIEAAAVTGGYHGIHSINEGSGKLSITTNGDVIGNDGAGILAVNAGEGALTITAESAVNGFRGVGIFAQNYSGAGLSINAVDVYGTDAGIVALHDGTGALSITATGDIIGDTFDGIFAENSNGTDLTIVTGSVTGGDDGINALHHGSGALSITANGTISADDDGIDATNDNGTNLTIVTGAVTGSDKGISAFNYGSGALSIITNGTIIGSGDDGIDARNFNGGITSITINGTVNSGTDAAIATRTDLGMLTNITLNSGASLTSGSGVAITNNEGDSNTIVRLGASVDGDVTLGDGSDDLTFDGGDFSAVTLYDGGDDSSSADGFVDRLTFANSGAFGPVDTSTMTNWEEIFLSNSVLGFTSDFTAPEILSLTDGSDLTITGNFTGTDGQLLMDVDLPTDVASTLTITGTSSGTTTLSVNAGTGGLATGNDITLVTVQGGGGASDFVLDGNPIGAYLFDLGTNGNDFFLTNASLSPETAVFESYLQILAGLNSLPDFNARFGGQGAAVSGGAPLGYASQGVALEIQSISRRNAIWARIEGTHSHLDPAQSTTGADYDVNQGKMRIGMDGQIAEADSGLLIAGVNASYGQAHADIGAASDNGTIEATGTSVGVSLTWLGTTGFYADAQAQYSWFSSNLDSDSLGTLESGNDGTGHALSLELGQRFENSHGFAITPQAQLTYAEVDFESFTSAFGTAVTAEEADSLKLRTGVAFEQGYSFINDAGNGGYGTVEALFNVVHEFRGDTSVAVAGTPLDSEADDWTAELGLAASFTGADGVYAIYGDAQVSTGLDDFADSYVLKGATGVKMMF